MEEVTQKRRTRSSSKSNSELMRNEAMSQFMKELMSHPKKKTTLDIAIEVISNFIYSLLITTLLLTIGVTLIGLSVTPVQCLGLAFILSVLKATLN